MPRKSFNPADFGVSQSWHARRPLTRALDVMALIIAFGIAAGFFHAAELAVARHVLGQLVWFSRDFVWMSPIAYSLALLPGGLMLALLAFVSGARWALGLAVFSIATAALFGVLLPYSQIARIAALLLAMGIGTQLARLALSSPDRILRWARRFAGAGATLVTALAVVMPGVRGWREGRVIAALPAVSADAPNVLIIILDTVRAASLGLYDGAPATAPRLREWALDGAVFEHAYAPAPWTLPSHASFFTGRYAGELAADWNVPLGSADSTVAEVFRERGYATGAFVANMHYTAWDSGLDRGFATYGDYRRSWMQLLLSASFTQTRLFRQLQTARSLGDAVKAIRSPDLSIDDKHRFDRKKADEVSRSFLEWQKVMGQRPFFAFLNYFDAHQPYWSPEAFRTFPNSATGIGHYHAAIAWLDAQIDGVMRELRSRGALDHTVVIISSDHGELFAEHGLSGHAHNLYQNVLRVPLLIRFPRRVPANLRVDAPVSLRDLPATIADLAAVHRSPLPGTSLAGTWSEGGGRPSPVISEVSRAPNVNSRYPSSRGAMTAFIDSAWHYIRSGDGAEQLFGWRADTAEARDLSKGDGGAERLAPWRARFDSLHQARKAGGR